MKRFYDKINKTKECWNWIGGLRNGYGAFKFNGKTYSSHRFILYLINGEFPNGFVCHKCDNRKCVNPDHLHIADQKWNMLDAYNKKRMYIPINKEHRFKRFNKPVTRKFTSSEVSSLKNKILKRGKKSLKKLSDELGISLHLIKDISSGRTYKDN